MSFQTGEIVGDYRVTGLLGQGGMGAVYSVQHLISHRMEAMKVLLPDLASSTDLADRFIHEIRLHASLSHPNIAVLHTALRVNNRLLMIMEHVEGVSLSDILRGNSLITGQALEIAIQVLDALGYAHEHGVVHRDVKPSNVMISPSGRVKLMDFGIARSVLGVSHLTQIGAALGSVFYMSPEQVRAEPADGRSDLYSLAITLFEMLTGHRPFSGENTYALMQAQVHQPAPSPAFFNPELSPALCAAILRGLEKHPASRFQFAKDFTLELQSIRDGLGKSPALAELTASIPAMRSVPTGKPGGTSGSYGSANVNFDPAGLERIRAQIAVHAGPVAKILVQQAAKRAATWTELYRILAPEIPEGKERERFLSQHQ